MNTKIVTYTGKSFDLLNPTPDMVCIEDIAHSLANICRYTGHVRQFYSVAQHSVLAAQADSSSNPLQRLLHDADEAYIGDIASPWKQLLCVDVAETKQALQHYVAVKAWEQKIQDVIGLALEVDLTHSAEVKVVDNRMYFTEVRDLMPPSKEFRLWKGDLKPFEEKIIPWLPEPAEEIFLVMYKMLNLERVKV